MNSIQKIEDKLKLYVKTVDMVTNSTGYVEGNMLLFNGDKPVSDKDAVGVCRFYIMNIKYCSKITLDKMMVDIPSDIRLVFNQCLEKYGNKCTIGVIDSLSIDKEYRKMGYGRVFLNLIENELKALDAHGVGLMSGWKKKDNTRLDSFYIQSGYKPATVFHGVNVMIKRFNNTVDTNKRKT